MASPRGDATSRHHFTLPLHDAARNGNLQRVAVLLVEGNVDVHAKDQDGGWTAVRAPPACRRQGAKARGWGCARHCAHPRARAPPTAAGRPATPPGRSRTRGCERIQRVLSRD